MTLREVRLSFIALLFAVLSTAQQKAIAPKLALEITHEKESPPEYVILDREGSVSTWQKIIPTATPGNLSQDPRPSGVRILFKVDGDAVSMNASVQFGSTDDVSDRRTYQPIGNFLARLNDVMVLSDLTKFGLQPLTLKIVTARPPRPTHPMPVTDVPSLQIEIVDEDRVFYDVAVHNISSRSVTAFLISMASGDSNVSSIQQGEGSSEVLAPGATCHVPFAVPRTGRIESGTFVEDPAPGFMTLEGALFADGTAEGKESTVAALQRRGGRDKGCL